AEDGIRDFHVTGVQTCALPISPSQGSGPAVPDVARAHGSSTKPRLGRPLTGLHASLPPARSLETRGTDAPSRGTGPRAADPQEDDEPWARRGTSNERRAGAAGR